MGYPACVCGGNDRKGRDEERGGSQKNKKLPVWRDPIYVKLFGRNEKNNNKKPQP